VALSVEIPLRDSPRPLAGTLPCGDRTFLPLTRAAIRPAPASSSVAWTTIRNVTTRALMTVAEFEKLPDDGNRHELDEGELIVMPPTGLRHGRVMRAVTVVLDRAAKETGSGEVLTDCGFRLAAGVVRATDVAFVREERRVGITEKFGDFAPDLAVEILSPEDNAARVQSKIRQYLAAGTSIVWVLDPDSVTVSVYEKSGVFRTLNAEDSIDAPALLTGFSARVRTLFE